MAIQDIETKEIKGTKGNKRGINTAATGMIMDIVQAQQYTKPIDSTVRELTANAVDSQIEKEKAIQILSGDSKPEDYFINREGDLYEDSKWNPGYYNLDNFSKINKVEIVYKEGEGTGRCDLFTVTDHGVGIGQSRLEGVLQLGYSTKRCRTDSLGAYGLGAKVGLATGSEYYILTTVYNKVKYKIKVFNRKINSLIGSLNLETGESNVPHTFSDGYVIFGEKVDCKNYTTIEVPCMQHHKHDYIRAVKNQLLYFNNVEFFIESVSGHRHQHHFKADVIHNSENIILAKSSPYSKPHVVIVKGGKNVDTQSGVCYGFIDFKEMELQDMYGDIGIKCPIRQVTEDEEGNEVVINEGIDVVPSRESVRWTPATRDFLKKRFQDAQEEATSILEEELKETDFLKWLDACRSMLRSSGNNVISRLSNILEISNLTPKYNGTKLKYQTILFDGFSVQRCVKYFDKKDYKHKVKREDVSIGSIDVNKVYVRTDTVSKYRDLYIADQYEGDCFYNIRPLSDDKIIASYQDKSENNKRVYSTIKNRDSVLALIKSSELYNSYEEVDVPQEWIDTLKQKEVKAEEQKVEAELTPAEKRELENRVVCNTLQIRPQWHEVSDYKTFTKSKKEPKIGEVAKYEGKLYYGFKEDESKLHFAAHLLYKQSKYDEFYNNEYKLVFISKSNKKHFKMHSHINDFFGVIKEENGEKEIVMDNAVVHWNTARKLESSFNELSFMQNYNALDNSVYEDYTLLCNYMRKYHVSLKGYYGRFGISEHYEEFVKFLDLVEKVQENMNSDLTDTELEGFKKGLAINKDITDICNKLEGYSSPIKVLFNNIPALTKPESNIDPELLMLLKEIISWKELKYVK